MDDSAQLSVAADRADGAVSQWHVLPRAAAEHGRYILKMSQNLFLDLIIIHQDVMPGAFHIVVLARPDCPEQYGDDDYHQYQ